MLIALIGLLRPKQWTKNLLVFAGFLFTIQQHHPADVFLRVIVAFGLFCAVSGATYIFNDIADVERDRNHPRKCKRPIASGLISPAKAAIVGVVLIAGSVGASLTWLRIEFTALLVGYFVLTTAYSMFLKHVVIVDLLTIAAGFVIRAAAGAVVIPVQISPWLLVCTTLLALFLGLAKRRSELVLLEDTSTSHRRTLGDYSAPMLDQMLTIASSACLMAYLLYTFSPNPTSGGAHPQMMVTIPFVVYGLFRYLFLIHTTDAAGSPEQLLIDDKPLLINVVLFVIAAAVALKL